MPGKARRKIPALLAQKLVLMPGRAGCCVADSWNERRLRRRRFQHKVAAHSLSTSLATAPESFSLLEDQTHRQRFRDGGRREIMGCPTILLATHGRGRRACSRRRTVGRRGPPMDHVEPKGLSRPCDAAQRPAAALLFLPDGRRHVHDYLAEYLRPPPGDDEYRTRAPPLDEDYHGVDALPTSSSRDYLCRLLEETDIEILIKKEMGCGGGHESRSYDSRTGTYINRSVNPYLQKRYHEYTMDIRPKAICRQLFAIREQISGELINDLRELPRKDGDLARARAVYDEDRPSFDESRLGDADGTRRLPAPHLLALACPARRREHPRTSITGTERTRRAHRGGFFCHNAWSLATRRSPSTRPPLISEAGRAVVRRRRAPRVADAVLTPLRHRGGGVDGAVRRHLAWNGGCSASGGRQSLLSSTGSLPRNATIGLRRWRSDRGAGPRRRRRRDAFNAAALRAAVVVVVGASPRRDRRRWEWPPRGAGRCCSGRAGAPIARSRRRRGEGSRRWASTLGPRRA